MQGSKENFIRYSLGTILIVIAINAFGGGYYGMAGAEKIPTEWLVSSPFNNYFIPSLILFVLIGISFFVAAILTFKQNRLARKFDFACGIILIIWIISQIAIIGYVSWMQPAIVIVAIIILVLTWKLPKYGY